MEPLQIISTHANFSEAIAAAGINATEADLLALERLSGVACHMTVKDAAGAVFVAWLTLGDVRSLHLFPAKESTGFLAACKLVGNALVPIRFPDGTALRFPALAKSVAQHYQSKSPEPYLLADF